MTLRLALSNMCSMLFSSKKIWIYSRYIKFLVAGCQKTCKITKEPVTVRRDSCQFGFRLILWKSDMVVRQPFQSTFDLKGINDFHFYITTERTFFYPLKGERRTVIPTKAEAIYLNNRFLPKSYRLGFPRPSALVNMHCRFYKSYPDQITLLMTLDISPIRYRSESPLIR